MQVDNSLKTNALVYKLSYPDSLTDKLSDKRLNISFGPYQVTNADVGLTKTGFEAEDPDPFFTIKDTEKSGNVTRTIKAGVGPTELFGFSRPASEGEPSINRTSQSITYQFKVGQGITWYALCAHRSEKRVTQHENRTEVERLWSNFTCQYTQESRSLENNTNEDVWVLSIDYGGPITMTQKGKPSTLTAQSTGGKYVKSNGQATKLTTLAAGYTWYQSKDGSDKSVAAISIREEKPRIWLDKTNSDSMNHVLSMANTGLLIYNWEIAHK